MFGFAWFSESSDPPPVPTLSLVGDDTTIADDVISGSGDLRIEGTVHADIDREGRVIIAPNGTIHGTVRAQSIHVAGTARGELHAETLVLADSSDVRARLQAESLTVEPGADFRGEVYDSERPQSTTNFIPPDHFPPALSPAALFETEEEEPMTPILNADNR